MTPLLKPRKVQIPDLNVSFGTGWLPPIYDPRDYTDTHPEVAQIVKELKIPPKDPVKLTLPASVDLRPFCSPIENQGGLGSCTANAAAGVVEYFENRAHQKYIDASRLFIYKNTRNLLGVTGDTGAWLRNTMGALVQCGVADEHYWPYTDAVPDFDAEPTSFVYSIADDYETTKYLCHDPLGASVPYPQVLARVKAYLVAGIPSMFGFWGYSSSMSGDVPGSFPVPDPSEPVQWGHAVVAVGYDNNIQIKNTMHPSIKSKGALLIRNSWDITFGDAGYGWIPYDYVLKNIAMDFWSLMKMGWIDTGKFHFS
jgi:C1A family cysteine protease